MRIIPGPCCMLCEKKKTTPYPITLDQSSGYICEECYKTNIWAKHGDNLKSNSLLDTVSHTKLFNTKEDTI